LRISTAMADKVGLRETLTRGWPVVAFAVGALALLVLFAPYAPAIPYAVALWAVAFVMLYKLGGWLRARMGN